LMKTLTLRSEVGPDGTLRLEVPSGLSPGPVEVVVVVQPAVETAETGGNETGSRPDTRPQTRRDCRTHPARTGVFKDRQVEEIDVDSALDEMSTSQLTPATP
jgi:hypothetical protein